MVLTDKGPIFFVHVPKTGGTSVEDYLSRRFGPLTLNDVNKREKIRGTGLICAINHLSSVDLREMIPEQSILVFAVVRNPLDRLLSEYRWQRGASRMSKFQFSTWLRIVTRCHAIDSRAYDNHIRPQSDLVPLETECFQLEKGFDAVVTRIDEVTQSERSDLSVGRFKHTDKVGKDIKVYREDVALVHRVYARDYERFGYAHQNLSQYPKDNVAPLRNLMGYGLGIAVSRKQRRDWLR